MVSYQCVGNDGKSQAYIHDFIYLENACDSDYNGHTREI